MSEEQSSIFSLGRTKPFPTNYPPNKTAVTFDILESGWIAAFVTIYFCYLLLVPAAHGTQQKIYYFVRVTGILFVGLVIMMVNFGQEWEVGDIESKMAYKAGTGQEIQAHVGVKIGLRSVNITLKATEEPKGDLTGQVINFNERFTFAGPQGRFGFGIYSGQMQKDFRKAQYKGVPYPILWVAEMFTFDGEGLRLGRYYRLAGLYARMCVWAAFPVWLLTIVLFHMVIAYAAMMLIFLGALLVSSSLIWANHRNVLELAVFFEDDTLKTHFGIHWYLSLIVGILCIICGICIRIMDHYFHNLVSRIMNLDPLRCCEQNIQDEFVQVNDAETQANEMEMADMSQATRTIRRTLTYVGKGRRTAARTYTETLAAPILPDRHSEMERTQSIYGGTVMNDLPPLYSQFPSQMEHLPAVTFAPFPGGYTNEGNEEPVYGNINETSEELYANVGEFSNVQQEPEPYFDNSGFTPGQHQLL